MTKRPGLFPPDVNDTMTRYWLQHPIGLKYYSGWCGENWWIDGSKTQRRLTPETALVERWTYLGPAPTYEQSQADAADARRFRWLLKQHSEIEALHDSPGVWLHDIGWAREARTADIRAAIDASMKEQGDG